MTRRGLELDGWDLVLFVLTMPLFLLTYFVLPLELRLWPGTRTLCFVSPVAGILLRHRFHPPPPPRERVEVSSLRRVGGLVVLGLGGFVMLVGGVALWAAFDLRDGPGAAFGSGGLVVGAAIAFGGFRLMGG